MPPLRERIEDIRSLLERFVMKFAKKENKVVSGYSNGVLKSFQKYSWPGNVRELENVVYRAVVLCDGDCLLIRHFRKHGDTNDIYRIKYLPHEEQVSEVKRYCRDYFNQYKHYPNKSQAAKGLNLSRQHIIDLVKECKDLNDYFQHI